MHITRECCEESWLSPCLPSSRRTSSPPIDGGLVSPGTDVASVSTVSRENITPIERPEKTPPTDLEIRLDTARAIDLFTMKPKVSGSKVGYS